VVAQCTAFLEQRSGGGETTLIHTIKNPTKTESMEDMVMVYFKVISHSHGQTAKTRSYGRYLVLSEVTF
jgi:hypothetical protein